MDFYDVNILERKKLGEEVHCFSLEIPEGISWKPGAHVNIGLPGFRDGEMPDKTLVHHMSIVIFLQSYLDYWYYIFLLFVLDQCFICIYNGKIGAWLSLVEHTAGGRGVAGSNPVAPIFFVFFHFRFLNFI